MKKYTIIIILSCLLIGLLLVIQKKNMDEKPIDPNEIRYVALGDSYTIGEGAEKNEAWPNLLTDHLIREGVSIRLIANPSVTGWTTQQVIDNELPVFDASNPTFATLLIGVNDYVQGVDIVSFKKNLIIILDHIQSKLPDKQKLLLVTIPDFSVTPNGMRFGNPKDSSQGILEFNKIITDEGKKRNLPVVDIFPISQEMKNNPELVAPDGLHPSAKEYAKWEELIFKETKKMLLP